MAYLTVTEEGELVSRHGFPTMVLHTPEFRLHTGDPLRHIHAWAHETPGAPANILGTVLLVALDYERRPYRGHIILSGLTVGLTPLAVATITGIHTAVRAALMGVASGFGPDFDQQAISTAQMATEGTRDDRTG